MKPQGMKIEDVKVGMKVVPFQRTVGGSLATWEDFLADDGHIADFFRENGFLVVCEVYPPNRLKLCCPDGAENGYWVFSNNDITPYVEPEDEVKGNLEITITIDHPNGRVQTITGTKALYFIGDESGIVGDWTPGELLIARNVLSEAAMEQATDMAVELTKKTVLEFIVTRGINDNELLGRVCERLEKMKERMGD